MKLLARYFAIIAFAFAAGFAARDMPGAQPPPVTAKTVLQSDVKGGVFEEAVVQVYEFQPGAALPWHIHPDAHEIAYILEGTLTLEIEGQGTRVFKQGDASHVAPNEVHRGFADATLGTKLVAVRFKPKDKPLVTLIQR
jgi:quercetin dioxygenase-like cupin family protein